MSLYRKYRPQDFKALKGQDHIRDILQGALKKKRVSHAYLFTGPRGTGKTSTARILARAINCLELKASGPCNDCEICKAALDERLTDLVEIDAASHGLVDDARALVEQARFMPTQAKKKIYIIDEVHMLSKSAFNALLKIIEEPPEHVHFILATTEAHKVLDTIVSRCQRFDFHLASDELISASLSEAAKAEGVKPAADALNLLALHARGSFRDALSLLEQVIGMGDFSIDQVRDTLGLSAQSAVDDFIIALGSADQHGALAIIHDVYAQGGDLYQFCQDILKGLRLELLHPKSTLSSMSLLSLVDIFFHALDQLRDPVMPELPLEMAVFKAIVNAGDEAPKQISKPKTEILKNADIPQTAPSSQPPQNPQTPLDPSFDPSRFISSIKPASLRSLLKFSHVAFGGQELKIVVKSPFELEKVKNRENQVEMMRVLREQHGDAAFISFAVIEKSGSGISAQDLKSVF